MRAINYGDGDGVMQSKAPSMSLFQGSSNFNIQNSDINQIYGNASFNQIQGNIAIIRFGDDQFTHDQRNWICDYISSHAGFPDINHNLNRTFLTQFIVNLPRAEAVFDDYRNKKKSGLCFEGTRVALLREMADWATNLDGSRMYVLSGLAGIGKSTVAYTIASRAADLNLLGASFFFSRDEPDRNNAKKLFTTIAYQLCVYDEVFAKAIGDALQTERGSVATTKDPQKQLQVLILDPLRNIVQSRTRPILVVVDALDECDEDDGYTVIIGLSQLVRELPPFKVILTTRPKAYINYFQDSKDGHKLFHLQDIENKVVDGDIRLYLKHSLSLEQVRKRFLKSKWCASDEEINHLVDAAGRLFIIASTAVRYILDKFASNPAVQMQNLLCAFAEDRTPFKDLDHFYTVILRNVIPADCDDDVIVGRYQLVVGAIIFVQQPLPVSTLTHLIDMNEDDIHAVLGHLQSVILLGEDNVPRIYHKSFPDYLMDQTRCKDAHLRIDPKVHHMHIATRCFEITNKRLKYNILGLGKMARYMSNEECLKEDEITHEQLRRKVSHEVSYACIYWINHLQAATIHADLMNGLTRFMNEHALHWIEVLSLIGKLGLAPHALRVVLQILDSTSSELYQLLSDTLRFISKFYEIIERSALHMYYSALPFSPTDSLLYRQFIKEERHKIFFVEGGPEKWDALVASPNHGQSFDFIKFSDNSALFISCSEEYAGYGTLKIWDATTGTPISTIPGQRFAVTNDFSTIASSKDDTITCYNMNGKRGDTLLASSKIWELAISSDSCRIAAALADGTLWLWKSRNGELIGRFDGSLLESQGKRSIMFREQVSSRLQFSSTGTRLVYSSKSEENSTMKLWDGMNGRFIADMQCGSYVRFVFSGDGSRIASRSNESGLTLWSSESGTLIGDVMDVRLGGLAISENGSLLANANQDKVTLWSENDGHLSQIGLLESIFAFSLAFSPNDILAIGTSDNVKLYDVKTHSFISTLRGFSPVLAFSSDSTRFAHGSNSQIYLWDIQGIDNSNSPSDEPAAVTAIALSRDCSRLACGYEDGRVELWGTSPTRQRIASHKAHKALAMGFGPDGRLFASVSFDGTIKLWNSEDGLLHGTIQLAPGGLWAVALSNRILVAAGISDVTLWSLDMLSFIHAFRKSSKSSTPTVSISDDGDLVVTVSYGGSVDLFHVENRTLIATFKVPGRFHILTFLPDKSYLVAQLFTGAFLSFNLIDKCMEEGVIFEHLIQLPNTLLWNGVPIWHCHAKGRHYFSALFAQHQKPVPVLWIPSNLPVTKWTEGLSMIALGCRDGRVILLRLVSTSHS